MKAHVRDVELDGTATEIAAVLAATIQARTPQLDAPAEAPAEEASEEIAAEVVEEEPEPEERPAFGVTRADDTTTRLKKIAYDIAGEDPPRPSYPEPPSWQDIPLEERRWGSKNTCHLRLPGEDGVRCPATKLHSVDSVLEYPQSPRIAKVCGTCWRRKIEATRKDKK